jgi:hypothetical protein
LSLVILEIESQGLFARAGLEVWSSLSQPSKELGLQVWAINTQQKTYHFLEDTSDKLPGQTSHQKIQSHRKA